VAIVFAIITPVRAEAVKQMIDPQKEKLKMQFY
jgi:hypothetical protein